MHNKLYFTNWFNFVYLFANKPYFIDQYNFWSTSEVISSLIIFEMNGIFSYLFMTVHHKELLNFRH